MELRSVDLPGYHVIATKYESPATFVCAAVRGHDQLPVVLKMLKPALASPMNTSRYHHEYEVIRLVRSARVVQAYAIETWENTLFLVLEDIGGVPLSQLLAGWQHVGTEQFSLTGFLTLACQIVEGIAAVHEAGIIHKDICPSNIVYNPKTGTLQIIDFDIATTLDREMPPPKGPRSLDATLAYIAPEQTGRTNRAVDYRADFYSLGVTFYELLTGHPALESTDAAELISYHLARTPVPPNALNPLVPEALSAIVMKLMAKAPEDRYQSSRGLLHDLRKCGPQGHAGVGSRTFDLGLSDQAERFLIPEKLYGRTREKTALLAAFDRVSAGATEIVMVTGASGIGKTAVVNEVRGPIERRRGHFIKGKFDQLNRGIPFSGFLQALRDLMVQLAGASDAELEKARAQIMSAVGENGQIIIDEVPELARIIGPQPPVPELTGIAAQNRFNLLIRKFMATFAAETHPLVIFLDDMQWADLASLELLRLLMEEGNAGFMLFVGAFRENEVGPAHPLRVTLGQIEKNGSAVSTISLAPLAERDVNALIADTLGCPPERASPLSSLVYQKTRGNPFFNNRFIEALHAEGLIAFNAEAGYWECDVARVGTLALGDDIVEFMSRQLQKLPGPTQEALKLAACIGNAFDLSTLAMIVQKSQVETATDVWPALQAGLVLPLGRAYRFYRGTGDSQDNPFSPGSQPPSYRFLHDRAQQAAYCLIPEEQRNLTHLHIGRVLGRRIPELEREDRIFEIVSQLNWGTELITDVTERRELAAMNLRAGRRAKIATAFRAAGGYLSVARRLLGEDGWRGDYRLTLAVFESSVEAAYLGGDLEEMRSLADIVLARARDVPDRCRVYEVEIEALAVQNRLREAIGFGLHVLVSLGIAFPEEPTDADVAAAIQETRHSYREQGIAALLDRPQMTDPLDLAAMRILVSISAAAFLSSPKLYALLILTQVRLSAERGTAPASAFCYASYGLILCGVMGDIEAGYSFGQLALDLLHRMNAREWECKIIGIVNTFIVHWKRHVRDTLAPLRSAYYIGLETGDLQFSGYAGFCYCAYMYLPGIEKGLAELQPEVLALSESIRQAKQVTVHHYFQMLLQAVHDLREGRANPRLLQGEYYDESVMMPLHVAANDGNGIFYVHFHKLLLSYLFGQYDQAVEDSSKFADYLDNAAPFPYLPIYCLYDSLARLAAYRHAPRSSTEMPRNTVAAEALLSAVAANQKKLKTWARHAPMNCQHKLDLVEAECQRTFGDKGEALAAYNRAVAGARDNGYLREEAVALELLAGCCVEWGMERISRLFLQEARACYGRWGADAKVAELEQRFPWLPSSPRKAPVVEGEQGPDLTGLTPLLDLETVVKASQAIAGEIELPRLLDRLMRIAIQNSGAQRAALLLEQDGEWLIEAEADMDADRFEVLKESALRGSDMVPAGIVLAVARDKTNVVLDDAAGTGAFIDEPRVRQRKIRSVICAPLVNQGRLSGILYLENNLITGAFTPQRLSLINLLLAQMALSLDNARLFAKARQEILDRRAAEESLGESERWFRTIFDFVNDAIFVADPNTGDILDVNATMCALWGYTRAEALQRSVEQLSEGRPPYSAVEAMAWMQKAARGEPQVVEWLARAKGSRLFWVEASLRQARINGQLRLIVAVRDITDRKQAEEALHQAGVVIENSPVVLFQWKPEPGWPAEFVSENIRRFGYSADDLRSGRVSYASLIHPDDLERVTREVQIHTARNEASFQQEYRILTRDGQVRWLDDRTAVTRDADGAVTRFQGIVVDITERKLAEVALLESEERFRSIVETSLISIFTVDDRYRFIYANDVMCGLMGYPRDELLGMDFRAVLTPEYQSLVADRYVRRQHGESLPHSYEIEVLRNGGQVRCVEMSVTVVRDPAGRPRTMGQMVDMTERKNAEKSIRLLNEELEQRVRERTTQLESVNRELESFSYSVSHDLRAPLRAIDGFTRILAEDYGTGLDAEGRRLCAVIRSNTHRMAGLIDDLLAFSRLGRLEMRTAPIDMTGLVSSVLKDLTTPEIAERLDLRLHPLPPAVGDSTMLRQVWVNLLSNALKFSSKRARIFIEVGSTERESEVEYCVRDNGAGFDMRYVDKLFGVFQRLHGEREFEGTGVGLAIVQRVIQRHGGKVWGSGDVDRGATFSFTLPRKGGRHE
jgi:protein kinase